MKQTEFSKSVLEINCELEVEKISKKIHNFLRRFRKRGVVVALSGGIDSSVVGGLLTRAIGKERVFGLLMPEQDSSENTKSLSRHLAEHFEIDYEYRNITPVLEAAGCYASRDEAIQRVIPEYNAAYASKIVLPNITEDAKYRIYSVVVQAPDGTQIKKRLTPDAYLQIVAATNFKQRVRKMMEYYHADRLNYAVSGTPNRQEYDQGFFVKLGDGAADLKLIAHLYKTQVYQLAEYLDIPEAIRNRPPTTDTYSLEQSQEEFYFSVPYDVFDLCLYGKNHNVPAEAVAGAVDLSVKQVEYVYQDIDKRRETTRYLHEPPVLIEPIPEIK